MVQIKNGHESPVRAVSGPNFRPPNSSHFRNLKRLKIDKVVSQKIKERKKKKRKKRKKGGRKKTRNCSGNVSLEENLNLDG